MTRPQVVCLHGLGRDGSDWDAVRGALGRFGPVATPDLPRDAAAALEAVDGALTGESIVIGHSMGAVLAMRAVARRPRALRAVILSGGFFAPARNGRTVVTTAADYAWHRVRFAAESRRRRAGGSQSPSLSELGSLVLHARRAPEREAALERAGGPPLLVHARDDHYVPISFAVGATLRHPGWQLSTLPGGGHYPHLRQPRAWLQVVEPWLDARLRAAA